MAILREGHGVNSMAITNYRSMAAVHVSVTVKVTITMHFSLFVHLFISLFITFLLNTLSQSLWKESNIYLFVCSYSKSGSAYGAVWEDNFTFSTDIEKNTALSNHLSYTGKQYHTHIISKTIMYPAFTHQSIVFAFSITTFIQAVSAEEQNWSCMMFWSPAHPKPLNTYFLLLLKKCGIQKYTSLWTSAWI